MTTDLQERKYKLCNKLIQKGIAKARVLSFPGLEGIPVYKVIVFFIRGVQKGSVSTRSSSIAFHFFLAVLPAVIFLTTLIPFIPIPDVKEALLSLLKDMMPVNAYHSLQHTLEVNIVKRSGLQVFGLLVSIFFAMNGINGVISAFNASYHTIETRTWLERRKISLILVFILSFQIFLAASLLVISKFTLNTLVEYNLLKTDFTFYLLQIGKWFVVGLLIFFTISSMYYLAPAKKTSWRFFSSGATFSSVLTIITSIAFSFFIDQYGQFNKLFGSIGTLMVILLWIYFNAIALLIGFELNASINNARKPETNL